ncbi:predicted protein [Nematostella vectensis]|uniref:Mab-21-like HhH/H2TH-like domain-containing protein n=1 Tax=Nematostella vectensis TaxID=45351 RepID=A7SGB3_NEMVE|nr:uncharacterized protein LOC5508727 [Nematostella vectensis]EDO37241.1 predicted protein [Nematostella vectensis]|eukprot:XP_001629304.1 predicted protein [Nematostella vectensis]
MDGPRMLFQNHHSWSKNSAQTSNWLMAETLQRPQRPFKPWMYGMSQARLKENRECNGERWVCFDDRESTTADKHSLCMNTQLSNPVEDFLEEILQKGAKFPNSEEDRLIRNNIEAMMEGLCNSLDQSFKMFRDCRLLKTGSTYEMLKIGMPDEFDFMIELPALGKNETFEFYQHNISTQAQLIYFDIKDRSFFQDIISKAMESNDDEYDDECSDGDFLTNVLNILEQVIREHFKMALLECWSLVVDPKLSIRRNLPQVAITPVFKWEGKEYKHLYVSVDLTFAIPIKKRPIWNHNRSNHLALGSNKKFILKDSSEVLHTLLRDGESCRISYSLHEQQIMSEFPLDTGQNQCLRLLKYFRNVICEQKFDPISLEMKSCISTYLLKTVMYYQFARHKDDPSKWQREQLFDRLLEALEDLLVCIKKSRLFSYFIPHYNLLKNLKFTDTQIQNVVYDVEEMLNVLKKLQTRAMNMEEFQELVAQKQKAVDALTYQGHRDHVIDLLYIYAYNDYQANNLEVIKQYAERYLKGIEIQGMGKDIVFLENGEQVNVDKELEQKYGEEISYFH